MVPNHSPRTFQLKGKSRRSDLVPFCEDWSKSEKPSEIKCLVIFGLSYIVKFTWQDLEKKLTQG